MKFGVGEGFTSFEAPEISDLNIDWNRDVFIKHLIHWLKASLFIEYSRVQSWLFRSWRRFGQVTLRYHDESWRWVIKTSLRNELTCKSVKVGLGPNLVTQENSNLVSPIWRYYNVINSHLNDSLKSNNNNEWVMMCEHLEVEEITGVTVEYKYGSNEVIEGHL